MKRALYLLASMCLVTVAQASSTVPRDRIITQILTYRDSLTVIYSPPYANSEGCANTGASSSYGVILIGNDPNKLLISTALAAFATGKTVGFGLNGCSTWYGGVPKIYRVDQVQ
jgi:hypothetical protein